VLDAPATAKISATVSRAARGFRSTVPLPLLIGGLLVTACVGLFSGFGTPVMHNDSYRYVVLLERILGHSTGQARSIALRWYCNGLLSGHSAAQVHACIAKWTARGGLGPNAPQYNQIFNSRPGYPLLAAPFAVLFGLNAGLTVLAWLVAIACGWFVMLLARVAGVGQAGSLAAMITFLLVPSFFWIRQDLTEGPTMLCTLLVLIGTIWALRGRTALGASTAVFGYVAGFAIRYSTFSVQAGTIAACILLLALCKRRYRTKRAYLISAYSFGGFVVMTVLPMLFGWPGFSQSLQDTFSDHFRKPVPTGLDHKWVGLAHSYVNQLLTSYQHHPMTPILAIFGLVILWLRTRELAAMVTAAALTGVATVVAHPVFSQGDRLSYQLYLLATFGIGVAADLLFSQLQSRTAGLIKARGSSAPRLQS